MQLSFEEFWTRATDELVLPFGRVTPATTLQGDLGFDSLTMTELIVLLDELHAPVPEGLIAALESAGDVYDLYCNHLVVRVGEDVR